MYLINHPKIPFKISITSFYSGGFEIGVYRNTTYFANRDWKKFLKTGIHKTSNCGRRGGVKYLACCQPIDEEHCYLSADRKTAYCKCCNATRILSNTEIDLKDLNKW